MDGELKLPKYVHPLGKSWASRFLMVQKGKSFGISPNIKVLTQQIWKIMFAGLNNCESFFFCSRVVSFPGSQLYTE